MTGGYTALSTKGVASLLSYTLWRVITFPVFYLLLAILVGTAVMQIKYVNRALQRFDATQVIPVQFVLFTLSVILGSAVLYRDFERTSGDDAGKFVGGCAMTFLGVSFITTGRRQRQDDEEDREPEPEDAINLIAEPYRDSIDEAHPSTASRRGSSLPRPSTPPRPCTARYHDDDDASRPSTPAIKLTSDSPPNLPDILTNPWASSTSSLPRPPQVERHTSTPILPSEAAPPPHALAAASDPELVPPRTPTRGKSSADIPTTPGTTPQLRRLRTNERLNRSSVSGSSGPLLASPLSTTLSAMVQDLKRTGNLGRAEGRRGSIFGIEANAQDGNAEGEALERRRTEEERPGGRGRSLSGTLGELWRGMRGRASREELLRDGTGGGNANREREGA